jgi:hypothetical protein
VLGALVTTLPRTLLSLAGQLNFKRVVEQILDMSFGEPRYLK